MSEVGSDGEKKLRKSDGRSQGKPFVKGHDPRRYLGGRPKSFDEFRKLAQAIAQEPLKLPDGRQISVAEALLRLCAKSKEPVLIKTFFEIAFGKVPDKIETTGLENKTTLILHYPHERPELSRN